MSNNSVIIAPATLQQVSAIEQCAVLAYKPYIARMNKTPAPMVADFKKQVQQQWVHVALLTEKTIGYIVCYPMHNTLHLENVAVLPDYHGMGVGKMLIQTAEAQALEKGLIEIQLYTNVLMHENIKMYAHLGFEEYDRKNQDGFERVFFRKPVP